MPVLRRVLALLAAMLLAAPVALADPMPVTGQGHVQNLGWMPTSTTIIGTTGKSLRMEALKIKGWPITYRAHVQNIGWMPWVVVGYDEFAGTTGRSLRMEAVQARLDPVAAERYAIEYQCHVQDLGWLAWTRDGGTCGTTGRSLRMEAIRMRVVERTSTPEPTATPTPEPTATPTPTATATPPAEGTTSIAVTADTGVDDPAGHAVMDAIGRSGAGLVSILGDLAYQPGRAADYCAMVSARVAAPVLLAPGNHEAQSGDGPYSAFVSCLPDRVGVSGDYDAGHYYVDRGPVRYIVMSPNIALPQGNRSYARGTVEREQVKDWIDAAKAEGRWVVVGMHIPCLTNGTHQCERDASIDEMLIGKHVDVVLAGHDHTYGRTHQVTGTALAPVVVDRDNAYAAGAGTVYVIAGNGGHNPRAATVTGGVWATSLSGATAGYVRVDATASRLSVTGVGVTGPLSDSATITR